MDETTKKTAGPCPVRGCGYNRNTREYDEALAAPIVLESTRSHNGADAHRDMDGFDPDVELARLRRAVESVRAVLRGKPTDVFADVVPTDDERLAVLRAEAAEDPHFLDWLRANPLVTGDSRTLDGATAQALVFIAHAFDNLDEHVRREGALPRAWLPPQTPSLAS
jgi:hypothetical protein